MKIPHRKKYPISIELFILTIGTAITAFALNMLIIPAGLLSGGLTGVSQFINHFIPVNIGVFYLILNIPLMLLGYKILGKKFSVYTIISIALLSIFLVLIPIKPIWTENILLCAIFGGAISSIGSGLVLRVGGSQGGTDILARIIIKYKNTTIGKVSLVINAVIVTISGFIFGSEIALFTICSIFASMKVSNYILNHVNRVSLLIITEKGDAVTHAITNELGRGTTCWHASGGYTKKEKTVLFCVIVEGELTQLKELVKKQDKDSFVSVISTQNVIGRFNQVW